MNNELNERVNPVSKTAVATLIQLAAAGYERSAEILKRLGFSERDYAWSLGDRDQLDKTCMVACRESRYVALNRVALDSGCGIIFDLPCGFVHRVFDMLEQGRTYAGGDLPAVISVLRPVILDMLPASQREKARFAETDITNYDSVAAALGRLEGPVCVCTEGLFVYLDEEEKKTVMENIRRLLAERGGCWLTVDPESLARHMAVYTAIAGDRAQEILMKEMQGFTGKSGVDLVGKSEKYLHKGGGEAGCESTGPYRKNGFLVEKIPFPADCELRSYAFLQPDTAEKVRKALTGVHVWKLTADPDYAPKEAGEAEKRFRLRTETEKGSLRFTLSGRLDSLSAPQFLQAWEKEKTAGKIRSVEIGCADLQYVSSAGLRVLMMMRKALPGKPIVLTDVNREVRQILKTAGFEDQFEIR